MSDHPPAPPETSSEGKVSCPECQSFEVRPSRSSYPQDKDKTGDEARSFWRCGNCGSRFLGVFVGEPTKRHRHQRKDPKSQLDREVQLARVLKRWVFPILVLVLTVIAVVYLLDRRDAPVEQIVVPG